MPNETPEPKPPAAERSDGRPVWDRKIDTGAEVSAALRATVLATGREQLYRLVVGLSVLSGATSAVVVGLGPGIRLSAGDLSFALGPVAIGTAAAWFFVASAPSAERRSVWLQLGLGYAAGALLVAFFPMFERLWG